MGSVYCANFPLGTSELVLERLLSRFGKIECLRIKKSHAFVCFEDDRDAENAIHRLNNMEFAGRKLIAEWATKDCDRHHARTASKWRPTKTLFVVDFDPRSTAKTDLERHFKQYGKVLDVRILRNYAFVDFSSQKDATSAREGTHMSYFGNRVLKVHYASRRSPSPFSRPRRGCPVYNRYDCPSYSRAWRSPSPVSRPRRGSPVYHRYDGPSHSRAWRSPSPVSRPRRGDPVFNRYDGPSYTRARSSDHRRYPSRPPARGSRR